MFVKQEVVEVVEGLCCQACYSWWLMLGLVSGTAVQVSHAAHGLPFVPYDLGCQQGTCMVEFLVPWLSHQEEVVEEVVNSHDLHYHSDYP